MSTLDASVRPRRAKSIRARLRKLKPLSFPTGIIGWLVLIGIWCAVTYSGAVGPQMLPSPTGLFRVFWRLVGHGFDGIPLWEHILASMYRCFSGFAVAVVTGVPIGLVLGYYPRLGRIANPVLAFVRPIPPIAYIPLAVLYFGIGNTSKIILIFFGAFLFIVLNTQSAVATVSDLLLRAGRNQGLTEAQLLRHVVLPGAMPGILTGVRTGFAISWALVVAAELIAANSGLGFMIEQGGEFFKLGVVYVGIVLIGIIGMLVDALIVRLQARILHWQGQ